VSRRQELEVELRELELRAVLELERAADDMVESARHAVEETARRGDQIDAMLAELRSFSAAA
jgi:hypothetical protein